MSKKTKFILCVLVLVVGTSLAVYGASGIFRTEGEPPANKEIYATVLYIGPGTPMDPQMEQLISEDVTESLKQKGFTVKGTINLGETIAKHGTANRALLDSLGGDQDVNDARIAWVTVVAEPGQEEGSMRVSYAIVDVYASDMRSAFANGASPEGKFYWVHEGPPFEMQARLAGVTLHQSLENSLALYAKQYERRMKTHDYRNLDPRAR